MARLTRSPNSITGRTSIDETYPVNCTIETSYIVDGHGEYSIRVSRLYNDPSLSWIIRKRFREFDEMNNVLKDYGYQFAFPKKKLFGNTDRIFMAERQKDLQAFLNALVQHVELCKSSLIQRFLSLPEHLVNYAESALQHVSMFLRSMNNIYQIIEPLPDLGWRREKTYFLASKTDVPSDERYLIVWCHYGLDKFLNEKDVTYCLKSLKSINHPSIVPIEEIYANESGILTIYRYYPQGSLKDYLYQTKPANGVYWKRYGPKSTSRKLNLNQIRTVGRQILESLYFIYENQLIYGHLHSGNLLFDYEQTFTIQLFDITNILAGVSAKYRSFYATLKHIHTFEQTDLYAFARLLYEFSTGEECPTNRCHDFPTTIPVVIREIITQICFPKGNMPTIKELLNDSFFRMEYVDVHDRISFKLNAKMKETFDQINQAVHERLDWDRIKLKNAQRQLKIAEHLMSDEEKLKRRRERQSKALQKQLNLNQTSSSSSSDTSKNLLQPINIDTLSLRTDLSASNKSLSPNLSTDQSNISEISPISNIPDDRDQLLNSITEFNFTYLKKTQTNDRSAPLMK